MRSETTPNPTAASKPTATSMPALPPMRRESSRGRPRAGHAHAHSAELLDRIARLRLVLPAMGQDLASARREAARLRVENNKLRSRLLKFEEGIGDATTLDSRASSAPRSATT